MTTEERRRNKEREIRAAMERILSGGAIHTDGAFNASTLAAEAGVSRQDLYRSYRALLEEFRSHLRRIEESGAPADRRGAELRRLGEKLSQAAARAARYRLERDDARSERDANASRVAYLDEQNRLLRRQLEAVPSALRSAGRTNEGPRASNGGIPASPRPGQDAAERPIRQNGSARG